MFFGYMSRLDWSSYEEAKKNRFFQFSCPIPCGWGDFVLHVSYFSFHLDGFASNGVNAILYFMRCYGTL